jgi:drug/metabolite transporter (DMT)-like permease
MIVGEKIPGFGDMLLIMLLGFLAIGLGVYFYVLAQSVIGAARTSSYYAVSPFIGVLLSLIIFREMPGVLFWVALLVMALGVYLNVTEES